jgi:putative thioredoxin
VDVTEAEFEAQVLERSKQLPVVVDFWATWCAPCRMLGPFLEQLAQERQGEFLLAKVNTDECPGLAAGFRIEAIPAVKAFRNGEIVLEFEGVLPEAALREFIDRICPTETEKLARKAAELEATRPEEAESLYRKILAAEWPPDVALVGLARVLLGRGQQAEASELLQRVTPGGEHAAEVDRLSAILSLGEMARDLPAESALRSRMESEPENAEVRYQLGCILAAAGRYPEALEVLLSAAQRDKKLGAGPVREAMVKVFQIVGVRSDLSEEYRDKLRSLLY